MTIMAASTDNNDSSGGKTPPSRLRRSNSTEPVVPEAQRLPTIAEAVPHLFVTEVDLEGVDSKDDKQENNKTTSNNNNNSESPTGSSTGITMAVTSEMGKDRKIPHASLPDINITLQDQAELDEKTYYHNNGYASTQTLDQDEAVPPYTPTVHRMGKRSLSIPSLYGGSKLSRQASKTNLMQRRLSAFTVHTSQRFSDRQLKTMATFSSVNYAPTHSPVYMGWLKDHPARLGWDRWILMLLIGIGIGLLATLLKQSLQALGNVRWGQVRKYAESGDLVWTYIWLAGIGTAFVVVSSFLVAFIHPPAAGSGVPEVISYLNGVIIHGTLSFKNLVVKFMSLLFAVSSGLPTATQGPIISMGAVVGCGIGQFESKTFGFKPTLFSRFRNPEDRRSFTTAGVAAGVAAAFNAPIGGLLFAMEDLSSFWSRRLSWQTFFCCGIAAASANLFNTAFTGFQYSGTFGLFSLTISEPLNMHIAIFLPAIVLGIVGGFLGALFTRLNTLMVKIRKNILKKISNKTLHGIARMSECVLLVLLFSGVVAFLPIAFECTEITKIKGPEGNVIKGVVANSTFKPETYTCKDNGTYSEVATILMNSGTEILARLSRRGMHRIYNYAALGSVLGCWLFMTCWTAGSAIAGGTFVPLLISGALYGRALGVAMLDLYKHATGDEYPIEKTWEWMDPGVMAIMGAAALLGGVTRLTLAITVIIVEMSQDIDIVVPLLLSNFVAKVVADMISKPLYKYQLDSKSLPYLDPELTIVIDGHVRNLEMYAAMDVMNSPVKTIHAVASISDLARLLLETEHGGFPVVRYDEETRIELAVGFLTRTELYVILKSDEVYNVDKIGTVIRPSIEYSEISVDYIADASAALERVRMYAKFPQYREIYVDLNNYVNLSAPKVDENHSLARTYTLFRTMGLRHLMVVDARNRVVGIITRKDLLPFSVVGRLIGVEQREAMDSDSENDFNDNSSDIRVLPAITKVIPQSTNGSITADESGVEYTSLPVSENNASLRSRERELPIRRKLDETNL